MHNRSSIVKRYSYPLKHVVRSLVPRYREHPSHILSLPPNGREDEQMTIAIGLMADTRQSADPSVPTTSHILLCADTLATYAPPKKTPVTSHPSQGKIYPLPHGFFAAFCDDYNWAHQIATEINGRMLSVDFSSNGVKDLIKDEVRQAFGYAFSWFRDEVLRDEAGITADEYLHDKKLSPKLRKQAEAVLHGRSAEVPVDLIIGGQTHRGPMLLFANGRGIRETTEFQVSGAPQESVISWLKYRDQRNNMSVARSFYHMIEAKRFAQLDPSVGQTTQMVWIPPTAQPMLFQDDGITWLKYWKDRFGLRPTDELDSDKIRSEFEEGTKKVAQAFVA